MQFKKNPILVVERSKKYQTSGFYINAARIAKLNTLNDLFAVIKTPLQGFGLDTTCQHPQYRDFRVGDVRHSQAGINKAQSLLNLTLHRNIR